MAANRTEAAVNVWRNSPQARIRWCEDPVLSGYARVLLGPQKDARSARNQ